MFEAKFLSTNQMVRPARMISLNSLAVNSVYWVLIYLAMGF